jgi:hypothetical protein
MIYNAPGGARIRSNNLHTPWLVVLLTKKIVMKTEFP